MKILLAISVLVLAGCATPRAKCGTCSVLEDELRYARDEAERLCRDLAEFEGKIKMKCFPRKIEGFVLGVGALILVSAGSEQGVSVGDEFTIFRGREFVARVRVVEAGPRESSVSVLFRWLDPVPGDALSNDIVASDISPVAH